MDNIELIALDLDGTLLDDKGKIPEENIEILQKFAKSNAIIALSSGRMTECVSPVADIMRIDCPLIVYNGAMVRARKSENREIIYHNPLPSEYGDMLIDYSLKHRFHLNYYLNDTLYAQEDKSLEKYALIYSRQTGATFHFLKDIRELKGNLPTKLILITDTFNKDVSRTRDFQYEYFMKKLGKKVNLVKTNPEYLEFLKKGVDKGIGLQKLSEFYRIKRENIIAFGDGENDVEMLKFAGMGVALSNAKEEVKKIADCVLEWDNNQAGVAKFLSKFKR
ncbi:HAD family phosphatase [Candidatus Calescamantes bacterium]|nr:HAD family phosphatase [Candidatus Calescamantes bacterium]